MALEYLLVLNTRWDNGIVLEIIDPDEEAASFVTRQEALTRISALLDEARSDLEQGGSSFPFDLAPGLEAFGSPAAFVEVNRALKARVAVYQESYQEALTALDGSFLDLDGDLDAGPRYNYSANAGDNSNALATDNDILAHPALRTEAQRQADGSLDARVASKTVPLDNPRFQAGITTDLDFTLYTSPSDDIPIIRNEELVLLLAEALWFTGERAEAVEALNEVRARSGGLEPIDMPASDAAFVTALLRERRFSLMFEGGHRWIDHRRFDRLDEIEVDRAGDVVPEAFPIPRSECLVRGLESPCGV